MKVVLFIPIKLNNQRLPGKNLMDLNGKPMCDYIFQTVKQVSNIDEKYVYCSDEKIQNYIVRELRRGATIYPAYGGLDHAEHVEVVTILEKNEYGKLLSFIHETDEHAFVTVSTVNEVVGAWNTVKSR